MAFQDFDLITEKRRNDRRQKLKRRIAVGAVATVVLAGIVGALVFVVLNQSEDKEKVSDSSKQNSPLPSRPGSAHPSPSSHSPPPPKETPKSEDAMPNNAGGDKLIKTFCNLTDFKEMCEASIGKELEKNSSVGEPKDVFKASIKVALDEVNNATNITQGMNFQSDQEKGAYEDCKALLANATEELGLSSTLVASVDLKDLSPVSSDLNSWLSAVISYTQTCVDGFPEGQLKTDMKGAFEGSKNLVSNALAILSELGTFANSVDSSEKVLAGAESGSRRLLSSPSSLLGGDGLPKWMNEEDRRMLKAADDKPTPNVTVAADGSGQFKTISEALKAIPEKYEGRYVIFVKEGVYDETVVVEQRMVNVTLYGEGSQKSIITGNKNFVDGVRTFLSASFVVVGDGFLGKAMGFRNTAGPDKLQAVAARVQGDRAVFVNCRFEGFQDTLYVQTHRQFYRSCVVSGTIDFIFGDAAVVFQNCILNLRKPLDNQQNIVTAQGRADKRETTGIVLQNCQIKADDSLTAVKDQIKSYLGRPWKEFSRTIVMESEIDDIIHPEGWLEWQGEFALSTLYYAEYNNTGNGAKTDNRVKWPGYKVIEKEEAKNYTVESFLTGDWISGFSVPVQRGFYNS